MIKFLAPLYFLTLLSNLPGADELPTPAVLPQRIYGQPKTPCLIRFDTLVFSPIQGSLLYDVEAGPGAQYNDFLLWHPKVAESGKTLQIGIYSGLNFRKLSQVTTQLICSDPKAITSQGTIRWLAIGDSLTVSGHYISQTLKTLSQAAPQIQWESVGTQHPKDNEGLSHEGRGGWSWVRYLEAHPPNSRFSSPFVYGPKGAEDFDFRRFVQDHLGGTPPDVITIFLGANDVYGISANFSPDQVHAIIAHAQLMVAKIQAGAPDSVIGIILPPPPSEQNGFGLNYRNSVTEWQYRRALQYYNAGMLQAFDGRWDEGLFIVPGYLQFDPAAAYPIASGRAQNALHPTEKGFLPISDSLSAWFIYLLSTDGVSLKTQ